MITIKIVFTMQSVRWYENLLDILQYIGCFDIRWHFEDTSQDRPDSERIFYCKKVNFSGSIVKVNIVNRGHEVDGSPHVGIQYGKSVAWGSLEDIIWTIKTKI
jgi:hypothetical protein